jgi:hypothetical protein
MKHRSLRWIAAILLWSTLGLLFALPSLSSGNWRSMLVASLAQWWSWGLVTPLIYWIDRRLPFKEDQLGRRILAHLPVSVVLTIVYYYVLLGMAAALGLSAWSRLAGFVPMGALQGLLWNWLVYWVIFGVLETAQYYQHYLGSELRLERLERSFSKRA